MSANREIRRMFSFVVLTIFLLFSGETVSADNVLTSTEKIELVMFYSVGCTYCVMWEKEIGVSYPKTEEGKRAPLLRIEIGSQKKILGLESRINSTPTFVLMKGSREIGRITGYPGDNFFYALLDELLGRLKENSSVR